MQREPDLSRRTQPSDLPELMDEPCSRDELRACLQDLAWVNRMLLGYRPVLHWLSCLRAHRPSETIRILDVGCGYGDTLRQVEAWSHKQGLSVELTGLDLNPDTAVIAAEASGKGSRIRWVTGNVFDYTPDEPPHVVMSSLFTHHLQDAELIEFLRWMESSALHGWMVNDLSRHPTPYRLFGWFSRLLRLHPFVQHDGPVSFARAFVSADWEHYCESAGLKRSEVEIRGFTPGRLLVGRRKRWA